MLLKWAIVGTGRICEDFCQALLTCDQQEHAIVAVSSREKTKAERFVKKFQLKENVRIYGSQEEVFDDDQVDIVYIGTIEEYHRNLCVKALNKNKHVLCEKPLAMDTNEVQEIIEAAKKTKKFMMEAIWSRFFPIYDYLREALKEIGTVTFVDCTFNSRNLNNDGHFSTLMIIGCYPIQAALIAFNHEEPEAIIATGHTKKYQGKQNDTLVSIILKYSNGRQAVLNSLGEDIESINSLKIYGTKGTISIPTYFWCPTQIILPNGKQIESSLPNTMKDTNFVHSAGLRYEAIACHQQILNGQNEHSYMTLENSLQIARIIEQARKQIDQSKY